MKVLFYINRLNGGGAERVISQLANFFSGNGDKSILVTSFRSDNEYELNEGVTRYSLEDEEIVQSRLMRNATRIKKLRAIIKSEGPDVVLSFMQEPNFRALVAGFGLPCKVVVSVRNDPAREYAGKIGGFVGKFLMPLLADGCVFQTHQAMEWFPARLRRKSRVIPNAVNPVFFETDKSGVNSYWVAIGRLTEQKNYPMMLKAFAAVRMDFPDECLRIYGEGPMRSDLQRMVYALGLSDGVALCGRTSDVPAVLADAKGFLMSSDYEGMPNALMEAMAVGLPCVVTDCPCGGPGELIADGTNGALVPVGNSRAMADQIKRLLVEDNVGNMTSAASESMKAYLPDKVFKAWKAYLIQISLGGCNEHPSS